MSSGQAPAPASVDNLSEAGGLDLRDDRVIAPAPDQSVLLRKRAPIKNAAAQSIHLRRTLIPILLTLGIVLPTAGLLKWVMGAGSAFAGMPTALTFGLLVAGPCFIALAAVNMSQVKHALASENSGRHAV